MKRGALFLLSAALVIFLTFPEAAAKTIYHKQQPGLPPSQPSIQQENSFQIDKLHDEIASIISGMPSGYPALLSLQQNRAWEKFRSFFDVSWENLKSKRLDLMETWAQSELFEAKRQTKIVFYPFGGPDFLTAYILFPDADTYILLGLEPPGNLPEIETFKHKSTEAYLTDLQGILSDYFQKSYFITRKMNEELDERKINGVLPLICIFLKRTDNILSEIKGVELDEQGNPLESEYTILKKRIKIPTGFKITFFKKDSNRIQTVYYISCDLSDEHFSSGAKFSRYLDHFETWTCLIKAASYLLHYRNFSSLRQLLLNKSSFILEDDTGIPYKFFLHGEWDIQLYGRYRKPVKDFTGVEQPDLKAAYEDKTKVKPLPFHLGYHWGTNLDCLILFKRKPKSVENSNLADEI